MKWTSRSDSDFSILTTTFLTIHTSLRVLTIGKSWPITLMNATTARQRSSKQRYIHLGFVTLFADVWYRHPDVPTFMTIDSHDCEGKGGHIQHDQAATPEQKEKGFDVNSTYYFPNASMSVA